MKLPEDGKYEYWHMMAFDTQQLINGKTTYNFFNDDGEENGERVGKIVEKELISWFLNKPGMINMLATELELTRNAMFFKEVKRPFIENGRAVPGDIDILILDGPNNSKSIAIECKRVKVTVNKDLSETINKINDLEWGSIQANGLREMGFYKSYLLVFIVTDARYDATPNSMLRKLSHESQRKILLFGGYDQLHENTGIIFVMISQPSGKNIYMNGSVALKERKKAKPQEQSGHVTEKIKEFLKMQEG